MSEHLDASLLNALVSGELSEQEREEARKHLAECSSCTAGALSSAMLKLATAKAGSAVYAVTAVCGENCSTESRFADGDQRDRQGERWWHGLRRPCWRLWH